MNTSLLLLFKLVFLIFIVTFVYSMLLLLQALSFTYLLIYLFALESEV